MIVRVCAHRIHCPHAERCPWNYGIDENCLKYFESKKDQARVKVYYSRAFVPEIDGLISVPRKKLKECPSSGALCLDTVRELI